MVLENQRINDGREEDDEKSEEHELHSPGPVRSAGPAYDWQEHKKRDGEEEKGMRELEEEERKRMRMERTESAFDAETA